MPKQDRGQHSRESDDIEDEKPLKKARYVWEVKGKYHLKGSNNNTIHKDNNIDTNKNKMVENKVCEDKGEFATKLDQGCSSKCCIQSFLAKTEALMSDVDDDKFSNNNVDENVMNEIPLTLVGLSPKNEGLFLQKWQARQIARGFVDNTINSVLETWSNPLFDATDLIENSENDGQVEDDAILMAIQSHGLQSSSQRNIQYSNSFPENDIALKKNIELEESTQDNFENFQAELIKENEVISLSSDTEIMSYESSNSNHVDQRDSMAGDPMDFLNAAVSVAIQKKGLSYSY